jgi:hypothetical protein
VNKGPENEPNTGGVEGAVGAGDSAAGARGTMGRAAARTPRTPDDAGDSAPDSFAAHSSTPDSSDFTTPDSSTLRPSLPGASRSDLNTDASPPAGSGAGSSTGAGADSGSESHAHADDQGPADVQAHPDGDDPRTGADDPATDADSGDGLALRRLMHSAVQDLAPSEGALEHLRAAVPARRARKRQALVGAAAAALLFGTAIPAFLHVASAADTGHDRTVTADHAERALGGESPDKGVVGSGRDSQVAPGNKAPGRSTPGGQRAPQDSPSSSKGGGVDIGKDPKNTFDSPLPICSADQLGVTAVKNAPRSNGTVYGSFRVSNVSDSECSVSGGGAVGFATEGAANPAKISVVQHTAGDPATGLPDTTQDATVALPPATAYEVRFAFVPSDTCPSEGADSPDPTPSDPDHSSANDPAPGTDLGSSDVAGMDTQLGAEDGDQGGGTEDGSVSVSHTPEPGAPVGETTIPNACAGTIYKTGPVDAPTA